METWDIRSDSCCISAMNSEFAWAVFYNCVPMSPFSSIVSVDGDLFMGLA
jgi:hypothetical protein